MQRRVLACPRGTRTHLGFCSTKLVEASEIRSQARLKVLKVAVPPPSRITSCSKIPKSGAHEQWQLEMEGILSQQGLGGVCVPCLGGSWKAWDEGAKLSVPAGPSFPPSTHGAAFSAWHLTCSHGSHEHPAPQNGPRYHSLGLTGFLQQGSGTGPARQESRGLV